MTTSYDLIIRNATVYDGTGAPGVRADVGVRGDRIAAVGTLDGRAAEEIDAAGLALAPGFIDVHAHDDSLVLVRPDVESKTMQGVTTVIIGNCGFGVVVLFMMDEADVRTVLCYPTTMIGIDGLDSGSKPHPRAFGTYPRILQHYVREEGLLTLEEAIHKMSGMPAATFDLPGRGVIRDGAFADLVLFDPATVADRATYADPRRPPTGMPYVFVNGIAVVRNGAHTHARAGRPLRRGIE
jgi:N-acyl-D-aspartate/D-glutamate deacylase